MTRSKQAVYWIILVVLVCAPVALAELFLRSAGLGYPILFYTNASYRFAPQPNQRQLRQKGAKVTIDSKGLRAVKDWTSPADGKLLFVGDSVTWGGTYIDDEDTFAAGVCERLGRTTGKTFVCGNAGANQYGTDNMAERIRCKDIDDETALIVTLISGDTVRGLRDADGSFFFTAPPPGPLRAVWEAMTFPCLAPVSRDAPAAIPSLRPRYAGGGTQPREPVRRGPRDAAAGPQGPDRPVAPRTRAGRQRNAGDTSCALGSRAIGLRFS
jgi:hypothetical protein